MLLTIKRPSGRNSHINGHVTPKMLEQAEHLLELMTFGSEGASG